MSTKGAEHPSAAALSQTTKTDPTSKAPDNGDGDDPYQGADVYDDCDIPLAVVSDHLLSGSSSIADNFAVGENCGTVQWGDAETSDAEEESDAPVVLGRGQHRKIVARCCEVPAWEEN
ncbi:hypothetical protein B0H10DRAFT_2243302 [Mycena sp. CBHHK59/15]|nr:hypothetical protein B0H10DRAFT_2243302 [Mycena sp. CBHHK59/15]